MSVTADRGGGKRSPPGEAVLKALGRLLLGRPPEGELDWPKVARLARRHALAPLLYWRLRELEAGQASTVHVPSHVMDGLQADFYASGARHLLADRHAAAVLQALAEAEIPVVVLKGATIAEFYPDPATRMYGDLDLLVSQPLLDEAEVILIGLGFSSRHTKAWWLGHLHHLPVMATEGDKFAVELHWRLDEQDGVGRLPVEELRARSVPWQVAGQSVRRLDPVDAVLHLCRHAAVQHRAQQGLRPLCDLALATATWSSPEWNALAQRAVAYGLGRTVHLMLVLAEEVFGPVAPEGMGAVLVPRDGADLSADLIVSRLYPEDGATVSVPKAVVQARAKENPSEAVRHLLWHLFLPREGMAVVYGIPADSPFIWLSYLWRPYDLLRRYGRAAWGALRGRRAARQAWRRELWLEEWLKGEEPPAG